MELPKVFPQILSLSDPSSYTLSLRGMDWTSTNSFLMNFIPNPITGSVGFSTLGQEDRRLTTENSDELRLSALAVTLDAWRILHRMVVESPASRDEIFGRMQTHSDINHALWSTRGEWKIKNYTPNLSLLTALADRVFTDGEKAPNLTGHVCLRHATGRMIDISMQPPDLGLHLAIGWSGEETEAVQSVFVDEEEAYTDGYFFSFSGGALEGLRSYLHLLSASPHTTVAAAKDTVSVTVKNHRRDTKPFMPLPEDLQGPLWDRAVERIVKRLSH